MKRKQESKKIISMLLVLSLVLGMIGIAPASKMAEAADAETTSTDITKVLSEELEGYRRISVADFARDSDDHRLVSIDTYAIDGGFQLPYGHDGRYIGDFGGKTYLDVDVNFNGDSKGRFDYQVNTSNRWFNYYFFEVTSSGLNFCYKDETSTGITYLFSDIKTSDYGISTSEYFNIKLLTDVRSDGTTDTVTLQLWLNSKYVGETTNTEVTHNREAILSYSQGNKYSVSFREPKVLEEELEGYQRITVTDFANTSEQKLVEVEGKAIAGACGFQLVYGENGLYTGDFGGKTYLDVDVNFNGDSKGRFEYQVDTSNRWYNYYSFQVTSSLLNVCYINDKAETSYLFQDVNTSDYGISTSEYFNIKLLTDVSSDGTTDTVTLQLWLNNKYVGETTNTEVTHNREAILSYSQGNKYNVSFREPYVLEKELEGYRKITMADYGFTMDSENVTQLTNSAAKGNAFGINFDKTYLDVDVNFNVEGTESGVYSKQYFQYQADVRYGDCFCISPDNGAIKLWMYSRAQGADDNGFGKTYDIASFKIADYGITSLKEYFNIKLRTDIEVNETNAENEDVTIQVWINDQFAYEGTVTQKAHDRSLFDSLVIQNAPLYVRSTLDIDEVLNGYERVTVGDFEGLGASKLEETETTIKTNNKVGKYEGNSLHKTYLDVDVKPDSDFFMHYPMSAEDNGTPDFYRTHYYRFALSGSELTITQVVNDVSTAKKIDISSYGYDQTVGGFFNLKIKTEITENVSDSTKSDIGVQIWVNDQYAGRVGTTETTYDMTCLGVRGNNGTTGTTVVKTPIAYEELSDVAYDLSAGSYLLTGADSFSVNGKTMAPGETLSTPGDYIIESIVDGEVVSKQCVSLYYLGDVNLDGSVFETGDPVYKDSYALEDIKKYGSSVKAMLKAADLDNDGEVTNTDWSLIYAIRQDVTQATTLLADYQVPALTFDYLGGDTVMPIGGFYVPNSEANVTDEVFKLIADSGINLLLPSTFDYNAKSELVEESLALAEKYGIGVFVKDSGLNTITKDENDLVTAHTYLSNADDIANRVGNYSSYESFLGNSLIDEPICKSTTSIDDFNTYAQTHYKRYDYYEKSAEALNQYTNMLGYINLYGTRVVTAGKYPTYLGDIVSDVKVLSFDSYLYFEKDETTQAARLAGYLESLDTVRKVAKENNKPFWSFVQAGTDYRDDKSAVETVGYYTEEDTLWIVNTSLAYGAKGIEYFPLLQPDWFAYYDKDGDGTIGEGEYDYNRNGIIGANNQKNNNYAMVQRANKQIAAIDEVLMKANNTGVIVTGDAATAVSNASTQRSYTFTGIKTKTDNTYTTKLKDVTLSSGSEANSMVGCFDYRGSEAFYVVNYDRTVDATQDIKLTFNGSHQYRIIQDAKTTYGSGESCTLTIPSGEGVLVVLEDHIVEYTAAHFATYRTGEEFVAPEAPVGYVFAGWFTDPACTSAVAKNATTVSVDTVYAKFVDENLLNMKAQLRASAKVSDEETDIRFVFAVDTLEYSKVGFLIKHGSTVRDRSSKNVYKELSVYYEGTKETFTPQNVFCETATRFKTWTLLGISEYSYHIPFEVTAYWITLDGTKVCGPEATKLITDAIR